MSAAVGGGVLKACTAPLRLNCGRRTMLRCALNPIRRSASTTTSSTTTRTPAQAASSSTLGLGSGPASGARPAAGGGSGPQRALPKVPNPYPVVLFTIAFAIVSWSGFTLVSTNQERTSSSIFKDVVIQVKTSPRVHALLFAPPAQPTTTTSTSSGTTTGPPVAAAMDPYTLRSSSASTTSSSQSPIVLKHEWWLAGAPYVRGTVGMMKGRIDLCFKITTLPPTAIPRANSSTTTSARDKPRTATVYFTSIRAEKGSAFEIIRFLVVQDEAPHASVSLLDAPTN